jgi:putative oxidoreductase
MDSALLILRVIVGLYLAAHGAQKLFGWFGGYGLTTTVQFMGTHMRFRPAWLWIVALVLAEFGGGLLMIVGLLDPIGPIAVAVSMLGAIFFGHWSKGPWGTNGGYELPLTYFVVAVAVAVAGAGAYSMDAWLGLSIPPAISTVVAVLMFVGLLGSAVTRRSLEVQRQTT